MTGRQIQTCAYVWSVVSWGFFRKLYRWIPQYVKISSNSIPNNIETLSLGVSELFLGMRHLFVHDWYRLLYDLPACTTIAPIIRTALESAAGLVMCHQMYLWDVLLILCHWSFELLLNVLLYMYLLSNLEFYIKFCRPRPWPITS